jgi:glycosyltransferase involved in cell wall biosynthesis
VFNQAGPFVGRALQLKRLIDGTPFMHKTASGYSRLELMMADQRPNVVVATSEYVQDWLREQRPDVRVECIPNGVDRSVFRPYSQGELASARNGSRAFDLGHPLVLFVGAMDAMKRPELLVSAVSRIPQASLVMIGSGRLQKSVCEMGERMLGEGRFVLIPLVSRDEIALYYNSCDVFTLPSEEPFGIVFLEAMACNKPVIAHDSPVQRWMFGDAGMTCDCTNPDEYATTIRRALATDPGTKPLERSRFFDWAEVVPAYERLFYELALTGRRR